jgi:epoxyqueuosine reductase
VRAIKKDKEQENYSRLKSFAEQLGISLFGVADLGKFNQQVFELSSRTLEGLKFGISLGAELSKRVIDDIESRPTKLYFHHYRQVNNFLDQTTLRMTRFIQGEGWEALPIPASQIIDWEKQRGHLSHKEVALRAGLGWIGRNNLLVNPEYGCRVRLATVLTNVPLNCDGPIGKDCGECRDCIEVCPVGAIKEKREDFDHLSCYERLRQFKKEGFVGQYICGICLKACRGK